MARDETPRGGSGLRGALGLGVDGPGDDRLSRQGHYHGPDGLNGRVRNGNGCGPAGMVAGKPTGRRRGRPVALQTGVRSRRPRLVKGGGRGASRAWQNECVTWAFRHRHGVVSRTHVRDRHGVWGRETRPRWAVVAPARLSSGRGAGDGSGWSSDRLLELVRCGGRPPYTPSPSTWSSSRSLLSLR